MQPVITQAATLPEWLTAIGGLLVFAATAVLAVVANNQMADGRRASAAEAAAVEKQIRASVAQGEAIREAARAQLQPMVFAHADKIDALAEDQPNAAPLGWPKLNPYRLGPGQIGFGYRLKNEGTGIALNIEHGMEIDGREIPFQGGMRFRALRPGEAQPAPADVPWAVVPEPPPGR
jgi:hypothetical protein